ncbi:unnamed protein product [Didymodactylos carnosus]|uniref:Uncharacterized protein n=1 Tax=Didymodactylos carnosus TaxID=1234261 RepID=A0A8S2HG50_9BILA|nr:unnamed protein product [Didymodactylos carnosus]CAF3643676.1 unnamed protein product [Didymodactylos carnosus]
MEDLGYDPNISKENTSSVFGLEVTGMKPKKTVTIKDPNPGRNRQIDRTHDLRRTNSDSPELKKTNDLFFPSSYQRSTKPSKKRSTSNGSSNSYSNPRSLIPIANIVVPREPF